MTGRVRTIRTTHDQRRRSSAAFMHDTFQLMVPSDSFKTRRGSTNSLLDTHYPTSASLGITENTRRSSLAPPSPNIHLARRKSAPDTSFTLRQRVSKDNAELKKSNVFAILAVVCLGLLLVVFFASYIKGFEINKWARPFMMWSQAGLLILLNFFVLIAPVDIFLIKENVLFPHGWFRGQKRKSHKCDQQMKEKTTH